MIKYHLMEERSLPRPELQRWTVATPLFANVWQRFARSEAASPTTTSGRWLMQVDWFERWNFIRL